MNLRAHSNVMRLVLDWKPAWRRLKALCLTADAAALLLLSFLFVFAFVVFLREPLGSDDCSYFEVAHGQLAGAPHHRQRFAHIFSIWALQQVFGFSLLSYYASPFVYGLGALVAVYVLTRAYAGVLAALTAALFVLGMPDVLNSLTLPLPGIPALFWLLVAVNLVVRGVERDTRRRAWAMAAGAALFLSASCHESIVVAFPGVLAFTVVVKARNKWSFLLMVGGTALGIALVEMLLLWVIYDDPLYRLHAVGGGHVEGMVRRSSKIRRDTYDFWRLLTRFVDVDQHLRSSFYQRNPVLGLGYFTWQNVLFGAACVGALLLRNRRLLALAALTLWAAAAISLAVVSLDPLFPVIRTKARYFVHVPALAAAFAAGAYSGVAHLMRKRVPRWTVASASLAFAALCLVVSGKIAWALSESSTSTVRAGNTRLTDIGSAIQALQSKGLVVHRALAPKRLRGGAFMWDVDEFQMISGNTFKARPHDLYVNKQEPLLNHGTGLAWTKLRKVDKYYLYGFWDSKHPFEVSSASRLFEKRGDTLARQGLALRAEIALELELYEGKLRGVNWLQTSIRGKVERDRLNFKVKDGIARVRQSIRRFRPDKLQSVAIEIVPKGRTSLRVIQADVRFNQAKKR